MTLDGVTIEEIERYHLRRLKLSVDKANEDIERHERQRAEAAEREHRDLKQHETSIENGLGRLKFD